MSLDVYLTRKREPNDADRAIALPRRGREELPMTLPETLHRANAAPPQWMRQAFYSAKNRVLSEYGTLVGHDIQEVRHACWECHGKGVIGEPGTDYISWPLGGTKCHKCGGDGIYSTRKYWLDRYTFGPYVFHRPLEIGVHPTAVPTIIGLIRHEPFEDSRDCALRIAWMYARGELLSMARWCLPSDMGESFIARQLRAVYEAHQIEKQVVEAAAITACPELLEIPF